MLKSLVLQSMVILQQNILQMLGWTGKTDVFYSIKSKQMRGRHTFHWVQHQGHSWKPWFWCLYCGVLLGANQVGLQWGNGAARGRLTVSCVHRNYFPSSYSTAPFHLLILQQRPCLLLLASLRADWMSSRFDIQPATPCGVLRVITCVFKVLKPRSQPD